MSENLPYEVKDILPFSSVFALRSDIDFTSLRQSRGSM